VPDPYAVDAEFYDLLHPPGGEDIGLWLSFAGRTDRPVLELGAGTGRIALELAGAGHSVTAVEPSAAMLAIANAKNEEQGLEVAFVEGSLTGLPLRDGDEYGLVLVPADVFLHCDDGEAQVAALQGLRSSLAFNGRLVIDLPGPAAYIDGLHNGEPVLVYSAASEGGGWLDAWQIHEDDLATQVRTLSMRYERTYPDGTVRRTISEQRLRYAYRFEMEYLAHRAGLHLLDVAGDYDLGPLTHDSDRMIFVFGRSDG
jgi:SAM-dependent methyltransferase